ARIEAPSESELLDALHRDADRFCVPRTTSLTHVFVAFARGAATAERAARLLGELRAAHVDPAEAPRRGDPFPLGFRLNQRTDAELDALLGAPFAGAVSGLPFES